MSLKSQRGSALVPVMVIAVLVGLMIPIIYNILDHSTTRERERRLRTDAISLVAGIRQQLEDPITCPRLIRGSLISGAPGGEAPIALQSGYGSNPNPITTNWEMGQIKIREVRIRTTGPTLGPVRLDSPVGTLNKYPVSLYIIPDGIKWNTGINFATGRPYYPEYVINLHVNVNPSGAIVTCHGIGSAGDVCESAGGAFDPDEPVPSMYCNPDKRCFPSQVGIVTSPAACPAPYTNVEHIGNFDGADRYLCSWCNDGLNNP